MMEVDVSISIFDCFPILFELYLAHIIEKTDVNKAILGQNPRDQTL